MHWEVLRTSLFYLFTLITLIGGLIVAFHRNLTWSVMGLMAALLGVAGLFGVINADFLAIVELVVYVGGVVILFLFAIFLTGKIDKIDLTNQSFNRLWAIPSAILLLAVLIYTGMKAPFHTVPSTTASIVRPLGDALLSRYLLPFEVVSVVLMVVLLGALLIAKREVDPAEKGPAKKDLKEHE